ncbi:MAG: helix-turn-helix transcriptional regulator [Bacillota bacterium]
MKIYNNIKSIRGDLNLSQKELAIKLDVSRQTINSIETGRYTPSLQLAMKISFIFNIRVEDIFFIRGDELNE